MIENTTGLAARGGQECPPYKRIHTMLRPTTLLLITGLLAGCGDKEAQDRTFFTSGNREADQRAEQRMAKDQQLRGEGEGKHPMKSDSKEAKAIAATSPAAPKGKTNAKPPLYQRIGGAEGINAIIDDFVTRALADPRMNWERKASPAAACSAFTRSRCTGTQTATTSTS